MDKTSARRQFEVTYNIYLLIMLISLITGFTIYLWGLQQNNLKQRTGWKLTVNLLKSSENPLGETNALELVTKYKR